MAYRVTWSARAKLDFQEKLEYLAKAKSPKAANQFLLLVERLTSYLEEHPQLGRPSPKKSGFRLLKIDKRNYLIYRLGKGEVKIMHLLPNSQLRNLV